MKKLLIATIPNMIEKQDTKELAKFCDIDWIVKDNISEVELANKAKDYDYLNPWIWERKYNKLGWRITNKRI